MASTGALLISGEHRYLKERFRLSLVLYVSETDKGGMKFPVFT